MSFIFHIVVIFSPEMNNWGISILVLVSDKLKATEFTQKKAFQLATLEDYK